MGWALKGLRAHGRPLLSGLPALLLLAGLAGVYLNKDILKLQVLVIHVYLGKGMCITWLVFGGRGCCRD